LDISPLRIDFGKIPVDSGALIARTVIITDDTAVMLRKIRLHNDQLPLHVIAGKPLERAMEDAQHVRVFDKNASMLVVTLAGGPRKVGRYESRLAVVVYDGVERTFEIPIFAEVVSSIQAVPKTAFFGEVNVGEWASTRVRLKSVEQRSFRIKSVETTDLPVKIEFTDTPVNEVEMQITGHATPENACGGKSVAIHYEMVETGYQGVLDVPLFMRVRTP